MATVLSLAFIRFFFPKEFHPLFWLNMSRITKDVANINLFKAMSLVFIQFCFVNQLHSTIADNDLSQYGKVEHH